MVKKAPPPKGEKRCKRPRHGEQVAKVSSDQELMCRVNQIIKKN